MTEPSEDTKNKAALFVSQKRKLEAVKLIYEATKCGLKEAKDYVDNLETVCVSSNIDELSPDYKDLDSGLMALMAQGKKLEAVKLYKDITGSGLAESKDYVEDLYKNRAAADNTRTAEPLRSRETEIDKILTEQHFKPGNKNAQANGSSGFSFLKLLIIILTGIGFLLFVFTIFK